MTDETTQTTLRDTITSAVETVEKAAPAEVAPTVEANTVQPAPEQTAAERARDEAGRFAKNQQPSPVTTPKAKPQRPSSWKKDYWPLWDKMAAGQALMPDEAEKWLSYNSERESDFAKGVSTYKAEWDKVKPIQEAFAPIAPMLQQMGLDTGAWVKNVGEVYKNLTSNNPQQKLQTLFTLARDFQVPLEEVFERAEDGRWYLNPQKLQSAQPQAQQPNIDQIVEQKFMEREAIKQVADLQSNKEKYPHLEQVRGTMAGLLQAGLVKDLSSAYDAALRMPYHAELYESIQAKQREAEEQRQREEAAKAVQTARAKTVSPRSSTPANPVSTEKGKGLRSTIEDAVNKVGGRV